MPDKDYVDWRPELSPMEVSAVAEATTELRRNLSVMRALREELGVTQEEFADLLGVTQSNVSKMEAKSEPRLSALRKLVEHKGGRLRLVVEMNGRQVEWPFMPTH